MALNFLSCEWCDCGMQNQQFCDSRVEILSSFQLPFAARSFSSEKSFTLYISGPFTKSVLVFILFSYFRNSVLVSSIVFKALLIL